MFLEYFKITGSAVIQIFLLGAIGYFLVKKEIFGSNCLNTISKLVIEVTLPILIFYQLAKNFSFELYPNWWIFPLISIAITAFGLLVGFIFIGLIKGSQSKIQFLSLVSFQNSGYLPLALVAALLSKAEADTMFIYLFMFLLGFNLLIWSLGVYLLSSSDSKKFKIGNLFSPPVIATVFSLVVIFFGLDRFVPEFVFKPLGAVGNCTIPLALFVVGGNLALIRLKQVNKKALFLVALVKMIILPLLGIVLIAKTNLPHLIGLLIIMELAVPPATSLSMIISKYKKEDILVSESIFFCHILSLLTLPLFLSLYFMISVIQ
ncbi:MAG: AEC family transporter [Candidatus Omnitrophica bacterium]|nr:AEC family transporter [Candidatus Omnitrophota bacterium]